MDDGDSVFLVRYEGYFVHGKDAFMMPLIKKYLMFIGLTVLFLNGCATIQVSSKNEPSLSLEAFAGGGLPPPSYNRISIKGDQLIAISHDGPSGAEKKTTVSIGKEKLGEFLGALQNSPFFKLGPEYKTEMTDGLYLSLSVTLMGKHNTVDWNAVNFPLLESTGMRDVFVVLNELAPEGFKLDLPDFDVHDYDGQTLADLLGALKKYMHEEYSRMDYIPSPGYPYSSNCHFYFPDQKELNVALSEDPVSPGKTVQNADVSPFLKSKIFQSSWVDKK